MTGKINHDITVKQLYRNHYHFNIQSIQKLLMRIFILFFILRIENHCYVLNLHAFQFKH